MSEREILFRGKDLQEQNGWLYGYFYKSDINKRERESGKATLIFTPDCDTFIYVPEYHNSWMVKAETVGQYTGLTDKNGTRIFEGDIVKYKIIGLNAFGKMEKRETKSIVKYNAPCFSPFETDLYEDYVMPDEAEVIGNIHDNPELLKGEQTWQQSK